MGCGIACFGWRGLKNTKIEKIVSKFVPWHLEGRRNSDFEGPWDFEVLWRHPSRSVQHPSRPHGAIRKASLLLRRGKRDWALLGYARRCAPRGSSSFFGECTAPPFEVRGSALLEVPAWQTLRPNFFVDDFFKHSYYLLTCYSCWHIITVTAKKVRSIHEDKLSMK